MTRCEKLLTIVLVLANKQHCSGPEQKLDMGLKYFSQAGMTRNLQDLAVNRSIPLRQGTEVDGGEAR